MTFEEKFEKIRTKFKKADTSVLTEDFAIQVNMTDEDCGGIFYVANIDGNFSVEPYDYYDHTSLLSIKSDDFMKVTAGTLSIDNGIAKGRFFAEGNIEDIKTLPRMFPKTEKKSTKEKKDSKEKSNGKGRKLRA